MAARISSWLVDGRCTSVAVPANETMPVLTLGGSSSTKARAAALAAEKRSGSTSRARMLNETSMASRMVCCWEGSTTDARGRAIPIRAAVSAASSRMAGRWRRSLGHAEARP
jgi:hypothetical protein